ncbi:MAG: hypothetical protein H8D34_11575 [Chloroflexi bacterium]|nr:hypothetical protein [Chloroflexota bacterium]
MDKTNSPPKKRSRKHQRFQVNPLTIPTTLQDSTSVAEETILLDSSTAQPKLPADQKIEIIPVDMILPDPWNPRHVLPDDIRRTFIAGDLDAEAGIRAWIKAGENDPMIADQIQQLRMMGTSLCEQGQINPINVARHYRKDGTFIWRIESGERRYWAKWLMIVDGLTEDRNIHAILRDTLDPTRQAAENLQTESLSAVGEARQISRLFLDLLEISPESKIAKGIEPGSDEYFQIALFPISDLLSGRKRLPYGFWNKLGDIIGTTRQHLERKLQILKLPSDLLSLADQSRLSERQLREILKRHAKDWGALITLTTQHDLTGPELSAIDKANDIKTAIQLIANRQRIMV